MRKILFSLLTITAVLVAVSGATSALFTSTASNNGNTFGAGTLVLEINGVPGSDSTPVFTISNAAPGDSSTQKLYLKNSGSINASSLYLTSVDVTDTGPNPANLADVLYVDMWEDLDDDNVLDAGETQWMTYTQMASISSSPDVNLGAINANETRNLAVKITFDPGAGNEYQGESVSFNFNFQANQ